ncbi:MAG: hypothetical protein V4694_02170 [Pseudomonadota bacterium]
MRNEEILKRTEEGMRESNKVLIRELIHDLEEKGIYPAWAIDGEVKKLKIIDESELKDFAAELKKFGLEKSDFCILEEDVCQASESPDSLDANIILIHKKTAKIKTYKAGNNSWIVDFHHDLQSNFFTN